jgi:hypothetical protein
MTPMTSRRASPYLFLLDLLALLLYLPLLRPQRASG